MPGYWWQCQLNPNHRLDKFEHACGARLVEFMYLLAATDWDQTQLVVRCDQCADGLMTINYEFPRVDRVQVSVRRIVGLTENRPNYLPMMWEAMPLHEVHSWFDFKYAGWSESTGLQAYGLARPAVFSRKELATLLSLYCRIANTDRFP
jgi:hypothetical protein